MFCGYCGAKLPEDSIFCEQCGAKVMEMMEETEERKGDEKTDVIISQKEEQEDFYTYFHKPEDL